MRWRHNAKSNAKCRLRQNLTVLVFLIHFNSDSPPSFFKAFKHVLKWLEFAQLWQKLRWFNWQHMITSEQVVVYRCWCLRCGSVTDCHCLLQDPVARCCFEHYFNNPIQWSWLNHQHHTLTIKLLSLFKTWNNTEFIKLRSARGKTPKINIVINYI